MQQYNELVLKVSNLKSIFPLKVQFLLKTNTICEGGRWCKF